MGCPNFGQRDWHLRHLSIGFTGARAFLLFVGGLAMDLTRFGDGPAFVVAVRVQSAVFGTFLLSLKSIAPSRLARSDS